MADPILPEVFISHSGNEGAVAELLPALIKGFKGKYEPLVDLANIGLGRRHRERIDEMIDVCDAGVVIISRAALAPDSWWVKYEAAQLTRRARFDESFAVVPIFIEGTGPVDVCTREWDPAALAQHNPAASGDADAMQADVVARLAPVREHVLATRVERGLAIPLRKLEPGTLRYAVEPLFEAGAPMWTAGELPLQAARRMMGADWRTLIEVLKRLGPAHADAAEEILEIVLPFVWVDRAAARKQRSRGHVGCLQRLDCGDLQRALAALPSALASPLPLATGRAPLSSQSGPAGGQARCAAAVESRSGYEISAGRAMLVLPPIGGTAPVGHACCSRATRQSPQHRRRQRLPQSWSRAGNHRRQEQLAAEM